VPQPQGPVEVQLRIGDDVHCARFATFAVDVAGTVRARQAPAPAACDAAPGCGNGVLTAAETCDDGNRADGDGCSSTCTLEDARGLCAGVPTSASTALRAVPVVTGLDRPVFVTAAPLDPDRLFVVEQDGLVRIVDHGVLRATPFLDLSHDIAFGTYDGMLGMAFHPDYASNGLFFVNFTNPDGATEVRHYQVSADPDVADAASGTTVIVLPIDVPPPAHNGGLVAFGPDGDLYVSMGDGSLGGDPFHRGQDDGVLLAKLLRLDVGTTPYAIPPTNPFAGDPTKRGEIWASGLRNPFRFSFDRATGDLYIGDVGQDAFEEIDVQPATSTGGENYGWSIFEADACYTPPCPPPAGFTFPVLAYPHTDGCDVTGGYVYRGCRLPALRGTYFYSDFCSAFVRTFRWSGGVATDAQDRTAEFPDVANVVSFGEDARGELYLVGYGNGADGAGAVYRIEPAE
jgi:cysteine-rich repeat protein